jgi:hypothetical protein
MYNRQPKIIADILDNFLVSYTDQQAFQRGKVLHSWRSIVGTTIADRCRHIRFDDKQRLIVYISDASWRHEIHMSRHQLIDLIHKSTNTSIISDIVVRS